ncbi:serine hydrolase domain-containing protein [Winogradskyella luteola]|uniref:Serine hydrolase n=1 Tax=Winogradskyella luteola TaxID=2828330 RepID=A0A9X1F5R3_9FLAO|nr:serine hydrolase domain-containing protein [Winogradskyella luteola]MBV7267574.1 serine hydrolase [Winogradskyella luteola]
MKKILYFTTCFFLFFSCKKDEKQTLSPEAIQIKNTLLKQKQLFDAPGIAFGIITNDTIVYADAHGIKSRDTKEPLTTSSLFHMASVSKPFVATAIVQLAERGKIDLDEKLIHYLPYYTMADERYKDITIKHMLTHTSGIPNIDDYGWDKPEYDDGAVERYARSQKNIKLDFTPGKKYSYSNPAFDILCDVIAKTSGMTFENYMKKNIFEPIGMKNSTFFKPDVPKDLETQPHVLGDSLQLVVSKIYPYNRRHAGSSTLHSNVEDMLLWANVYLNKGSINGKQIFNEASYELLTSFHFPEGEKQVCLSWFFGKLNDSPLYYHSGRDTGYSTFFSFMPEQKSAVIMMTNTDKFWTMNNAASILKNSVFNDTLRSKAPIHFKLKDYILKDGIEKVKEIYYAEQQKKPQDYYVNAKYLDNLGYWLIDRKHPKEALDVFLYLVEVEPDYAGWVSSVADAYKELDSINMAIKWHKKALKMEPSYEYAKEEIERLSKKTIE